MSNGFQFYEGTKTDSANTPKITVRKGGVLILTKAAVDKLGEDVTHVQVGYNEKSGAIGIRRAGEDARGRYRLRTSDLTHTGEKGSKRAYQAGWFRDYETNPFRGKSVSC